MSLLPTLLVIHPVTWVPLFHKPPHVQLEWEDKGSHVPTLPDHGCKPFYSTLHIQVAKIAALKGN